MSLEISSFRSVQGERLILDNNPIQNTLRAIKAELPFLDRVVNFFKPGDDKYGTVQQQQENREFKTGFMAALVKAEGWEIANKAVKAAGLKPGWALTAKPMDEQTVKRVLDGAQALRQKAMFVTDRVMTSFLRQDGNPSFSHSVSTAGTRLPGSDVDNPALRALFRREVKLHPDYGKRPLMAGDLQVIAQKTAEKFEGMKQAQFREQHPGLAQYVQGNAGTPFEDTRSFFGELLPRLSTSTAQGHPLSGEPVKFRGVAQETLLEVSKNHELLQQMSYDPEDWKAHGDDLFRAFNRLGELETQLGALAGNDLPQTQEGQDLMAGLAAEIRHQRDLLLAKAGFLDDLVANDPLGQKMVDYSNLLWAHAAGKIFDQAIAGTTDQQVIDRLTVAKTGFLRMYQEIYDGSEPGPRAPEPGSVKKDVHPATLGKSTAKDYLQTMLRQAGVPKDTIKELTSSESLGKARRDALNENQDWAPIRREMVVHRDGVTRTYESRITPGWAINPRFERMYGAHKGVSAVTKDDLDHPRNLKVSELVLKQPGQQEQTRIKVIGHGVLDMWDIPDPQQRMDTNDAGAHEVLEAAISVNDRVRTEALLRVQNGNPAPVKITHVSVNLITPSGVRELPGIRSLKGTHDYQEQTYTKEQFEAFHQHTTERNGGPVTFHVDDDRPPGNGVVNQGQDTQIQVDVDVISFSFGINPLATGDWMPQSLGGWDSVYDHNRGMMEKFVGDLGTGEFGARGSRPGGFIGSVLDRLDMTRPEHRALAGRIQEQTDLVRVMFTTESFKTGNGDPAKMGRHILALQGLAEEALGLAGVTDQGATMSKGCKSDKDRGGVTDVELKHQIITEDMGGQILPDGRLEGDDQQNYYIVSVGSGQLENQIYNTGLPGSKEAGKLDKRIESREVRQFLSGLGSFVEE